MNKIGIIGCGNMGGAIAQALCEKKGFQVMLYDNDHEKLAFSAEKLGAKAAVSLQNLLEENTLLLIAVKPQVLPSLYAQLRSYGSASRMWISIAAGVPLSVLATQLGTANVVRYMPNIAAQVKQAVTAVAVHADAQSNLENLAMEIATSFGSAFALPESQFAAFIGISGSAIAYAFQFFHALAMGGVEEGIPYPIALSIARDTCLSAAALQKESNKNAVELATMVCSAGGTTIKGMKALAKGNFDATVMDAVSASAEKSRSLEQAAQRNG
ncbi:MAG: pyrroline-5-carboxylate reductase [Sphaerochaeta sp.]|nr:pyrroline-5-carboxylate reductase [Sphaerochaeta sp.]